MYRKEARSRCAAENSELRFFALTNVDICPLAGKSESGVSFLAVNKGQILSLAELS